MSKYTNVKDTPLGFHSFYCFWIWIKLILSFLSLFTAERDYQGDELDVVLHLLRLVCMFIVAIGIKKFKPSAYKAFMFMGYEKIFESILYVLIGSYEYIVVLVIQVLEIVYYQNRKSLFYQDNVIEISQINNDLLPPRFCRNCGTKINEDDNYCPSCGAKIVK